MKMRKSIVHLAVAGSMLAAAGAASLVSAQEVSRSNTGQALIFPYYTVNDGWVTTFNFMNTSPNTLAVKVRFHERKNSRDVLDFNIVMSPYDMWSGWVQADGDNGPQLFTNDKSCTSPRVVNGAKASNIAYTKEFDDTGGGGFPRMRDGYVEVLLMGETDTIETPPTDWVAGGDTTQYVPYHAEHVAGVPRDCEIVDNAFIRTSANWVPDTDPTTYAGTIAVNQLNGSGDPTARIDFGPPVGNPLKGNVAWLQLGTGAGAGSEAIAVSNWSTENYVTAQQFPWFLEPTFASGTALWTVTGVAAFERAVAALSTFNEWADNPATGAATDWVVTFPTKAYHVDQFNEQIQAAVSKYRNGLDDVVACTDSAGDPSNAPADRESCVLAVTSPIPPSPFEHLFGVQGTGDSTITVTYDLFDREEGTTTIETDGTVISPAPPPEITIDTLRWEANVIAFAGSSVLGNPNPAVLDASAVLGGAANGWAKVSFTGAGQAGLPVAAFAVKVRDQAEASSNYGQAMDNGYEPVTPTAPAMQ